LLSSLWGVHLEPGQFRRPKYLLENDKWENNSEILIYFPIFPDISAVTSG
jgi:hypothetical protein